MNIISWIRNMISVEARLTDHQAEHYVKFEQALQESDLQVYVYDDKLRGEQLVRQGSELHVVTPRNLVSFRKLVRRERRFIKHNYDSRTKSLG